MSAFKKYLVQQNQWNMLALDHSRPSDFYLSAWQTSRSPVPLLVWRTLLFLTALSITLSSIIIYILNGQFAYWFIYLTHWGLTTITLTTGWATAISARCYFYGPIGAGVSLPWYLKALWVLYNVAVPLAFLITIFYWTLLFEAGISEELNHALDLSIHGLNSIIMFLLLISSSVPSRLLHFYQPYVFALCYTLFGVIYYLAGGEDQDGNPWVYPVVNWANPGRTLGVVAATGLLLIFLHILTCCIAIGRDKLSAKLLRSDPSPVRPEEGVSLQQNVQSSS